MSRHINVDLSSDPHNFGKPSFASPSSPSSPFTMPIVPKITVTRRSKRNQPNKQPQLVDGNELYRIGKVSIKFRRSKR
jgi:hypothetical protein